MNFPRNRTAFASLLALVPAFAFAQPLAFPGAEGFGALATGGRAGKLVHVTTLEDSGPGSLRDAVKEQNRFVVFDVGGVINLKSPLDFASNITVAGQSAPGDGIAVVGSSVSLSGEKNIVIRYMRFREGLTGPRGKCAININKGENIILDHCSIEWGRWDCLGVTESSTVTIQWCIIGEGIDPQKFGCLCETDFITFSHNLWINNQSRNPKAKGKVQYVNNVVYNWGVCGLVGGHSGADHWLDCTNNYFIKGPNSNNTALGQFAATDKVFHSGNFVDLDKDGKLNGKEATNNNFGKDKGAATILKEATVLPKVPVTVHSAAEAYEKVIAGAGASLKRDSVDARLIEEAKSLGTAGRIILDPTLSGGQGQVAGGKVPTDTDQDGISDEWEKAHQMNAGDASDGMTVSKETGWTSLEEYLNSLVR